MSPSSAPREIRAREIAPSASDWRLNCQQEANAPPESSSRISIEAPAGCRHDGDESAGTLAHPLREEASAGPGRSMSSMSALSPSSVKTRTDSR